MSYQDEIKVLDKYTPSFVRESEGKTCIYTAIAMKLAELKVAIGNFGNQIWTGRGLSLKASETKTLTRFGEDEAELQSKIKDSLNINSLRGTEDKLTEELLFLINSNNSNNVRKFEKEECGLVIDVTYPGGETSFIDVNKMVKINVPSVNIIEGGAVYGVSEYETSSYYSSIAVPNNNDFTGAAARDLVPVDVEVVVEEI